jgi:uncharacterized protein (DUF885 family)
MHQRRVVACAVAGLALAGIRGLTGAEKKPAAGEAFARLSDGFVRELLALSPVNASQAGYHQHTDGAGKTVELDARLDDMGPEAYERLGRFYREWRERIDREAPAEALDAQDRADRKLIDDQIALGVLELTKLQSHKYNPTGVAELIGNGLFLPLTQEYAPKDVRLGHVVARLKAVPRALDEAKKALVDADPVFVKVAVMENDGNVGLIKETIDAEFAEDSPLRDDYEEAASRAIAALRSFSKWLEEDLGKRPPSRSWRLGSELYAEKFRLVMQTAVTPDQMLADAEAELKAVRAEMLQLATPLHKQYYPDRKDPKDKGRDRENRIVAEVLDKIAERHARRDELIQAVERDLASITAFIREKRIVSLSPRNNLKVIPTPPFMRGVYSVAGFHAAPPLEPGAEAQYWVTPIDPAAPEEFAESRLREYNDNVLQWLTIHEALPGHYVQAEHANDVQPERRRLIRNLFGNGPNVEGWAEYVGQVMMDAGYGGGDPRFRLSMRKIRLRVLANAILDVRMQTRGMTDQEAMNLMMLDAFQTRAEAEGKLQRAKLTSAQLPTYYVGLREWLAFRKQYETAKGSAFDMLAFHDAALGQGPLPVGLLGSLVR